MKERLLKLGTTRTKKAEKARRRFIKLAEQDGVSKQQVRILSRALGLDMSDVETAALSSDADAVLDIVAELATRPKNGTRDYQLQRHDVVETLADARQQDPGSKSTTYPAGQMRLRVLGTDSQDSQPIGWMSQEREYTLHNEVRKVLHKSKLNVAESWAVALAEGEHLRRMEHVFQKMETFSERTEIVESKSWHDHFPAKYRPLIYSWMTAASKNEKDSLQWFMTELAIAEEQQLRVLPNWLYIENTIRNRMKCLNEKRVELPMSRNSVHSIKNIKLADLPGAGLGGSFSPLSESSSTDDDDYEYDYDDVDDDEDNHQQDDLRNTRTYADFVSLDDKAPVSCAVRLQAFAQILWHNICKSPQRQTFALVSCIFMYTVTLFELLRYFQQKAIENDSQYKCKKPTTVSGNLQLVELWIVYVIFLSGLLRVVVAKKWLKNAAVVLTSAVTVSAIGYFVAKGKCPVDENFAKKCPVDEYLIAALCGPIGALIGILVCIGILWNPPPEHVKGIRDAAREQRAEQLAARGA
eukprot:COSAG02_NODE_2504_length_8663_cov_3.628211_2_plen_525_part_00